jgi:drug/metabolite transporter (DMT)-like permease
VPADIFAAAAGLLAAALWGAGDFGGGIAAKRLPVFITLLGVQGVGLVGAIGGVLLLGEPLPTPGDAALAAAAGICGAVGLAGLYRALADGRMGIVAPVTGLLAAAIPVVVGIGLAGLPGPVRLAGFATGLLAIVLVSLSDDGATGRDGLLLAVGAGIAFGLYSTCIGQVSRGVLAPLVVSRGTSVTLVAAIVAATRPAVRADARRVALVVTVGLLDLGGNACFLLAAHAGGLALAAVLGSLYPVATVVLAAAVLRERIGRVHAVGIGAAGLAALLIVGGA